MLTADQRAPGTGLRQATRIGSSDQTELSRYAETKLSFFASFVSV
jgi:hypothetical protein